MFLGRLPEPVISLRRGAAPMLIQINEGRFGSFASFCHSRLMSGLQSFVLILAKH